MPVIEAGTEAARTRAAAGGHAKAAGSFNQLCEMQGALRSDILSENTKPAERAQSMRAYIEAEKLKRVMRGLPANTSQSIKSEPKQKRARVSGPVEPIEVSEPVKLVDKMPDRVSEPTPAKPLLAQAEGVDKSKDKTEGAWAKAMGETEA